MDDDFLDFLDFMYEVYRKGPNLMPESMTGLKI